MDRNQQGNSREICRSSSHLSSFMSRVLCTTDCQPEREKKYKGIGGITSNEGSIDLGDVHRFVFDAKNQSGALPKSEDAVGA